MSRFITTLLEYVISKPELVYLHDVFAIVLFQKPSLFTFKIGNVDIMLEGPSRGQSKFKENNISGNIQVAVGLDKHKFNHSLLNNISGK